MIVVRYTPDLHFYWEMGNSFSFELNLLARLLTDWLILIVRCRRRRLHRQYDTADRCTCRSFAMIMKPLIVVD